MAKPKKRRGHTRGSEARNGAIVLAIIAVLCLVAMMIGQGRFSKSSMVTVRLDNIGAALRVGSDVKMKGVIVGSVASIDPRPGGTVLKLKLAPSELRGIPANVVASVLPSTVFGTAAIDLNVHGRATKARLAAGEVISQDRAQPTLELQAALDDVDGLVKALGPADLNNALSSVAQAVDGRGSQLAATIRTADDLVRRVTVSMPLIRKDLALFATNMRLVTHDAPPILNGIAAGLPLANSLVKLAGPFANTLVAAQTLIQTVTTFFGANAPALTQAIDQGSAAIQVTYENRIDGIVRSFDANSALATTGPPAIHDGRVRIVGGIATDVRPYYTAADCPTYGTLRGRC